MPRDRRGDAGPGHVAVANPTRSNDGKLSVPGSRPGSMGRVEAALRNPTPPVSTSHRAGEVRGLPTGCDVDPAEPFRPSFAPEPRIPAMISGSARQRREFAVYASVRRSRGRRDPARLAPAGRAREPVLGQRSAIRAAPGTHADRAKSQRCAGLAVPCGLREPRPSPSAGRFAVPYVHGERHATILGALPDDDVPHGQGVRPTTLGLDPDGCATDLVQHVR